MDSSAGGGHRTVKDDVCKDSSFRSAVHSFVFSIFLFIALPGPLPTALIAPNDRIRVKQTAPSAHCFRPGCEKLQLRLAGGKGETQRRITFQMLAAPNYAFPMRTFIRRFIRRFTRIRSILNLRPGPISMMATSPEKAHFIAELCGERPESFPRRNLRNIVINAHKTCHVTW